MSGDRGGARGWAAAHVSVWSRGVRAAGQTVQSNTRGPRTQHVQGAERRGLRRVAGGEGGRACRAGQVQRGKSPGVRRSKR